MLFPTFAFFCAFLFSLGRFGLPYFLVCSFLVACQRAFFANVAARSFLTSLPRPGGRPWVGLDCRTGLFGLLASLASRRSSLMLQRVPFYFSWVGLDCRTCLFGRFASSAVRVVVANARSALFVSRTFSGLRPFCSAHFPVFRFFWVNNVIVVADC